jgi:hypothetical protein
MARIIFDHHLKHYLAEQAWVEETLQTLGEKQCVTE